MDIGRHTPLFFDASVLVAGAHSPQGGSALLLEACKARGFRAQTTFVILLEALHALRGFPQRSRRRFRQLLVEVNWELLVVPPAATLERYRRYVDARDVHVLAAAVEGKAPFLLTLDRRHLLPAAGPVREAGLPITVFTPGDFIQRYYSQHQAYRNLPRPRAEQGTT